jgi:hypothetical protein
VTTISEQRPAIGTERPTPVLDLRMGDVITRAPHTDHPVRWTLAGDPTTCHRMHLAFSVHAGPDLIPLTFRRADAVMAVKA